MSLLATLLLLIAFLPAAMHAADATFYVGTSTKSGKSQGIYVGKIDADTGKIGPLKLAAEAQNPSCVPLSPDGKFLYAAVDAGRGAVAAFAVQADGTLQALNQGETGGAGTVHVWIDKTGATVLAADYRSGSIAAVRTQPDGSLGERSAFVQFAGIGPNPKRQDKPHAHAIYTDAAERFAYSPDLGTDNVWIFQFDPAKGTLIPAKPPSAKVPPGGGPRHLAFHPSGKFAFVCNEMAMTATSFACDEKSAALQEIETVSTLPPNTEITGFSAAEICCHPNGKFLYVSNRTHDTLAVFDIAADGRLTLIENAPAGVKVPRGFDLDPSGRWLIAGGQNDDKIVVRPVCVLFALAK